MCYASFFLSITQGPFNRYDALMPQLDRPTVWDTDRVWRGVQRSAWGYFKKLAVADRAAVVVDAVFANPAAFDRTQLLLGGVLFTVQLYADFSGYTDIVLGVGEVLGLHLPETSASRSLPTRSRTSGRGGTSACRSGCGITSIFRWAAAGAARRARTET